MPGHVPGHRRVRYRPRMSASEYAFDPEFADLIAVLPTELADLSDPASIRAAREGNFAFGAGEVPDRTDVVKTDRVVPGPDGAPDVPVRIYTSTDPIDGLRGALVYIHGGGFILGSIDMMDQACQHYAADTDAVIVSVEYRLAPEDPFPAGLEDCYAALVWTVANADRARRRRRSHRHRRSDRAGGGLAAGTALLARDRGGPADVLSSCSRSRSSTTGSRPRRCNAFTDTPLWNRPNAVRSWKLVPGGSTTPPDPPTCRTYAAPARCRGPRRAPARRSCR